jgi:hypothetical protein
VANFRHGQRAGCRTALAAHAILKYYFTGDAKLLIFG